MGLLKRCSCIPILAVGLTVGMVSTAHAQSAEEQLWDASMAGDTLAVGQALAEGADVNALDTRRNPNGRRALNWAAWYNNVSVIEQLLAAGAEIDGVNNTGFSALHHAAEAGSPDAARMLIARGADPNLTNFAGRAPIQTARANGHDELVEILSEASDPE
ncbi:MAG: ankyrin repeat domain-containing protein [Gemmatimonadales bacterium]|nr:ankyrin repeat domain-containing protein [Gemmatimonadales bacterium]